MPPRCARKLEASAGHSAPFAVRAVNSPIRATTQQPRAMPESRGPERNGPEVCRRLQRREVEEAQLEPARPLAAAAGDAAPVVELAAQAGRLPAMPLNRHSRLKTASGQHAPPSCLRGPN